VDERRWVLDTNTLVSRLLLPGGTAARAVDRALALGVPLVSDETLAELADVLARPRFDRWVTLAERQAFIRLLGGVARKVRVVHRVQACRDPRDDKFLHVALNGQAQAIVTGDRDLLVLDPFHGVRIVTPAAFCAWT
jgi:putative PIN family toxin of toxin-antitoxin system